MYLVTGAAGFIGSRFVQSCNHKDIPVTSVDLLEHFESRPEHQGIRFGEKIDREKLFSFLENESLKYKAIVHLGACTDTTEMDQNYLQKINTEYSQVLWNYASKNKIPLVYASSAATYGDGSQGYSDDEDLLHTLRPLNPYGKSKQDFDIWALREEKNGNHPPTWCGFKFFNVYGFGEQHKSRMSSVILQAFEQIKKNGSVKLFRSHRDGIKDGEQKRDFIFVDDVVHVLHFALEKPIRRGILNLGSGKARTFLDLTLAVFQALSKSPSIEFIDTPLDIRDKYQYFTEARMNRLIQEEGYTRPFYSLEEGVKSYVDQLSGRASL